MISIENIHPFYQTSPGKYMVIVCKVWFSFVQFRAKKCGRRDGKQWTVNRR